jgi:hypothetical protein
VRAFGRRARGIAADSAAVPTIFFKRSAGVVLASDFGGAPVDGPETVLSTVPAPSTAGICSLRVAISCSGDRCAAARVRAAPSWECGFVKMRRVHWKTSAITHPCKTVLSMQSNCR